MPHIWPIIALLEMIRSWFLVNASFHQMHHFMTGEFALGQLKIRLLMKAIQSNNQAPEFEFFSTNCEDWVASSLLLSL